MFEHSIRIRSQKEDRSTCRTCKGKLRHDSVDQNDCYRGCTGYYCDQCESRYAEPLNLMKTKKQIKKQFAERLKKIKEDFARYIQKHKD